MEADKATAAIHEAAVKVLAADPTPAVAVRLLRDVLG